METLSDASVRRADAALCRADGVIARLVEAHGGCRLRPAAAPLDALATSVVNQQLSQRAAAAIFARVSQVARAASARVGSAEAPADGILSAGADALRAAGLSARKVACLQGLARAAQAGRLDAARWRALSDAEVIAELTAHPGIGRWSAEMFLMFCLRRPDIVSASDAGLRRAARRWYGAPAGDEASALLRAAERWRPWRTVGCWHLWRSLRPAERAEPPRLSDRAGTRSPS